MQLSSVVLPEPVPPEISTLQRTRPMIASSVALRRGWTLSDELVEREAVLLEFANGEGGPSIERGGAITLTRLPSGKRASQIGLELIDPPSDWLTMRWQIFISCALSAKRIGSCTLPSTSM